VAKFTKFKGRASKGRGLKAPAHPPPLAINDTNGLGIIPLTLNPVESFMTESIENRLNVAMKTALKAKDKDTLMTIRMVKAAMQELMNRPKAPEATTDALWQEVIGGYMKKLDKSAEEYKKVGERGQEKLSQIEGEKVFLKPFLPAQIEGEALKAIVMQAIEATGASSPKDTGRVMGSIMKAHKGEVDSKSVKDLIAAALTQA